MHVCELGWRYVPSDRVGGYSRRTTIESAGGENFLAVVYEADRHPYEPNRSLPCFVLSFGRDSEELENVFLFSPADKTELATLLAFLALLPERKEP